MIKKDIVNKVAGMMNLSLSEAEEVVESVFTVVKNALVSGEKIGLHGFGSFRVVNKNPRPGRNPKTGEEIMIAARKVITFKASDKLKKAVNHLPPEQDG